MSGHRVAWEVFSEAAKIKTTWVPYPGGGPALTAVAGGHVDVAATNPGNVKPMIEAGKVRVLAVSGCTPALDMMKRTLTALGASPAWT